MRFQHTAKFRFIDYSCLSTISAVAQMPNPFLHPLEDARVLSVSVPSDCNGTSISRAAMLLRLALDDDNSKVLDDFDHAKQALISSLSQRRLLRQFKARDKFSTKIPEPSKVRQFHRVWCVCIFLFQHISLFFARFVSATAL